MILRGLFTRGVLCYMHEVLRFYARISCHAFRIMLASHRKPGAAGSRRFQGAVSAVCCQEVQG